MDKVRGEGDEKGPRGARHASVASSRARPPVGQRGGGRQRPARTGWQVAGGASRDSARCSEASGWAGLPGSTRGLGCMRVRRAPRMGFRGSRVRIPPSRLGKQF